jgi:hypothetical protein
MSLAAPSLSEWLVTTVAAGIEDDPLAASARFHTSRWHRCSGLADRRGRPRSITQGDR